ncbi:phosphatidylethanolamine-binding protein [Onchocerca flexuosa]|uniref:Phosphatidylethanolamine-binding protein n=1 Tax=Onchocerca flexuosa TaxID=387005 RepID=A0A238BVU6_9BILA|nr:phosphatidylethanolamine-binding protein [Onchocerca flexuosa]
MADLAAKFAENEITPKIIQNPPAKLLNCNWDGIQVQPGQTMSPRHLRFAPRVTLDVDPESTFSMIMIDPDNLSRKNPSVAEWLHWLVVNIPASNIQEGINGGQHQMAYGSPAPQPRTDLHRYIILLYEHQGRRIQVPKINSRAKFSVKQFVEKHKLGDPIAGNFFLAQNESQ